LYQQINQNNILANEKYGFRNNSSTEKASFELINEILLALNNKLTVGGIFCDTEKAFDSVNHDILLSKCEFYGFTGKTNALLRSYLSNRYQRVLINNSSSNTTTFSEWGKMKHGVPQGSIFGPSFFLININYLPNVIADPSKLILFADDISIIITNLSPSKFKEDIDNIIYNINDWFRGNALSLNFDKTYFLQFRPKNSYEINIKISCDNKLIKETKYTKFLGLDIDSSLSWKNHLDHMMSKLSRACYAIRYVKHFMSQDTIRTIYFSYFHSIPSYGIIFWGNSAYSSNIFKIQKRIIRIIMNAKNRDSVVNYSRI